MSTEKQKLSNELDLADKFQKSILRFEVEFGNDANEEETLAFAKELNYIISQLPDEPVRTPYFKTLFNSARKDYLEIDIESS